MLALKHHVLSIPWSIESCFPINLQQLIVGYTNGYTVVYLVVQTHTHIIPYHHIAGVICNYIYISP